MVSRRQLACFLWWFLTARSARLAPREEHEGCASADLGSPNSSFELHCRTELTRIKRSGDCSFSIKHLCHFEHCRSDSWVFLETPQCHSYKPFH